MSGIKKTLYLLVILLVLPLLFANIVNHQEVGNFSFSLMKLEDYPVIGSYVPTYLFWASILAMIVLIIIFFSIVFYPKNETDISVSKSKGTLSVKKKAVEQFIVAAVSQEFWIKNPKVTVNMKKKKMSVYVSGECYQSTENIIGKTADLSTRLKQELTDFIGITKEKQVFLEVKNITPEVKNTKRVV